MAITYPLNFPSIRGVANITYRATRADSFSASPFTFAGQVIKHQGQQFEADITLPPMDRAEAEEFVSFLLRLDGRSGTFLFSPPENASPRGVASGSVLVSGAGQTGAELIVDGLPPSETGVFLAGDFIQTGSGSTTRLYKVLNDANADGLGAATLDIWPQIRTSPPDNSAVIYTNPAGLFRLSDPSQDWSIDDATIYGIAFSVMEAL